MFEMRVAPEVCFVQEKMPYSVTDRTFSFLCYSCVIFLFFLRVEKKEKEIGQNIFIFI